MATTELEVKRENRKLKKHLRYLVAANRAAIAALDFAMKSPESHERGKRVAQLCGGLEYATDAADHFGLGTDFPAQKRDKVAAARARAVSQGE